MSRGQFIDPTAGKTTFKQYADRWVKAHQGELNSSQAAERRLRLHAYPYIGSRPLGSFKREPIRDWLGDLKWALPTESHRRIVVATVSAVLSAAVDDDLLTRNPCRARSVQVPKASSPRVRPWSSEQVFAVRAALPGRYQLSVDVGGGCGLRQGEIFGLSEDEVDDVTGWLNISHQIKRIRGEFVFAPPKGGKARAVPLAAYVSSAIRAHVAIFPPVTVTLPWRTPDGEPVTKRLYLSGPTGTYIRSSHFNDRLWKPALATVGIIDAPEDGERFAAAREHGMHALRHFYASVLLDAGENIKALSAYLGHADPGFTLRTYTHLMPSSEMRTRKAIDDLFGP